MTFNPDNPEQFEEWFNGLSKVEQVAYVGTLSNVSKPYTLGEVLGVYLEEHPEGIISTATDDFDELYDEPTCSDPECFMCGDE